MRILLLARHGQSLLNVRGVVNGDPGLDQGLSPLGIEEGRGLARQLSGIEIDVCVTSEFPRARETARLVLGERAETTPALVDPGLNDIRIGELEGDTVAAYRAWKAEHGRSTRFPGGESLDEAARRYADAFERLLEREEETVLCICHEIPVRYAVNGARDSDELDGPLHDVANATPYVFDAPGLRRATATMRRLAG